MMKCVVSLAIALAIGCGQKQAPAVPDHPSTGSAASTNGSTGGASYGGVGSGSARGAHE